MSSMEDFFRKYYRQMCNYCANFDYNYADVEEMAVTVIMKHYEEYCQRCETEEQVRRWLNRRIMLSIKSLYTDRVKYLRTQALTPAHLEDAMHYDDPCEIVSVMQRLPKVPQLLIDYEQVRGFKGVEYKEKSRETTRTNVWRLRKKFLQDLDNENGKIRAVSQ